MPRSHRNLPAPRAFLAKIYPPAASSGARRRSRPAVRGLLGLEADLAHGSLYVHPQLPAHWKSVRFGRFAIGAHRLDGEIHQRPGQTSMTLSYDGGPLDVRLRPVLPFAARLRRVLVNGKPMAARPSDSAKPSAVAIDFTLNRQTEVVIEYDGGVGIVPPEPRPEPGDRTTTLKILRVEQKTDVKGGQIALMLAGLGGRSYTLDLVTTVPGLTAEGAEVQKTDNGYRLKISFEGPDYVTRQIVLRF